MAQQDCFGNGERPPCPRPIPQHRSWDQGSSETCLYYAITTCLRWIVYAKYERRGSNPQRISFDADELLAKLLSLTEGLRQADNDNDSWQSMHVILDHLQKNPIEMEAEGYDHSEFEYLLTAASKPICNFQMAYEVCEEENSHMVIIYKDNPGAAQPVMAHAVVYQGVWQWNGRLEIYCQNSYGLHSDPVVWVTEENFLLAYQLEPIVVLNAKRGPPFVLQELPQDHHYEEFARAFGRSDWEGKIQVVDQETGTSQWNGPDPHVVQGLCAGGRGGRAAVAAGRRRDFELVVHPDVEELRWQARQELGRGFTHTVEALAAQPGEQQDRSAQNALDSFRGALGPAGAIASLNGRARDFQEGQARFREAANMIRLDRAFLEQDAGQCIARQLGAIVQMHVATRAEVAGQQVQGLSDRVAVLTRGMEAILAQNAAVREEAFRGLMPLLLRHAQDRAHDHRDGV